MSEETQEGKPEAAPPADVPAGASTVDPSPPPAVEPPAPPAPPADPPIAPDIPRLVRPDGTSKAIPETILHPLPSALFLAVVSVVSLVADVGTKLFAEKKLEGTYPGGGQPYVLIKDHLTFVIAHNKGGAWGLLQGESENVRRPFFLLVSVAAILFIVTLYRRLQPKQYALKWGLPLVLGGALGNVFDRIRYGHVIDFIDYRADWIKSLNELIQKYYPKHVVTDHWPTFNVADIAICVGVALMAVDMLTSRRGKKEAPKGPDVPIEPTGPTGEPDLAASASADLAPPAVDAAAAGETSASTADGAPAPEGATDIPPPRPESTS
jgi:signal peptidase II